MLNSKPLFIFEMANNHMGDIDHGIKIIDEVKKKSDLFPEFQYAFKLQYRDDSFFHPDHIGRKDHKLIKRFTETRLGDKNFTKLTNYIKESGFLSICTPWDEIAVKYIIEKNYDIIKIASCSFNDWSLLEAVAKEEKFIIASTAGATKLEIDKVYSFLRHKNKEFALMYCVGEYPTPNSNLHLNQIDYLKNSFQKTRIGWSTHEEPNNFESIKIALSKGASIFEKHVGVEDEKKNYKLNPYSADPNQVENWLSSAKKSLEICGQFSNKRKTFQIKKNKIFEFFIEEAYASKDLKPNEVLNNNFFLAMPNIEKQLVAKISVNFQFLKVK